MYVIYGVGGFGREVYCALRDTLDQVSGAMPPVSFMVDDTYWREGLSVFGCPVIARSAFDEGASQVLVAIGDPAARRAAVEGLPAKTHYDTLIHRRAIVSPFVRIGKGSIITANCILTCDIEIGRHVHLNLATTVGHDCRLADYVTTAPGVHLSGNVSIGEGAYIGTGACVREKASIAAGAVVGMGAAVVKSIPEAGTYTGVPAAKR